ncbi:phage holin family protein [Acinetobacter haemolyticus]|uniref:phage holin family protein n=1 Tax=Acinetobacter haemolyticus TaxID=29430 RepID=UPI002A69CF4A|nr:phage holin family protein [Acinetobacter haemolyticus]WPO68786.1 phage holin family protein [Acinetobacter haemolyticus]
MWDELLKYLKEIYEAFGIAFASFLMAFTMALIRTKRKHGKADWLEAGMCGLFAVGTWSLLMWFNVPEMVAVGAASAIGFKGTHFVSDLIDKKAGGNDEINR